MQFQVSVISKNKHLQLCPFDLCFTCLRDTQDITERLSTVTVTLAAIESSQRILSVAKTRLHSTKASKLERQI